MLSYCNLPYAYHTIGSSMATSCEAYCKQGGMNKRKAGEDFYFLNKIMQLGNFHELKTTTVRPSPRISSRVPFGTGKAVNDIVNHKRQTAYNPLIFEQIKIFTGRLDKLYNNEFLEFIIPIDISTYLLNIGIEEALSEIKTHVGNIDSFKKRFYVWFDAFKVLKCIHYLRDNYFIDIPVLIASMKLLELLAIESSEKDERAHLNLCRELDIK